MEVLFTVALAFLSGLLLVPILQALLNIFRGHRQEGSQDLRTMLTRRIEAWKPPLVGLFLGAATLACGFSGVNVDATGSQAQLVPIWIGALVILTQIALPFIAGMLAVTYALARWGREALKPPR